jgi:hypothetical protein
VGTEHIDALCQEVFAPCAQRLRWLSYGISLKGLCACVFAMLDETCKCVIFRHWESDG